MDAASFDVVLSQMVLHLLPDPPTAAAEFFRVLVPGGRCVASVPSDSPGWEFIGEIYGKYFPQATGPDGGALPRRTSTSSPPWPAPASRSSRDEQVEVEFHFPDEQGWWEWGWCNGVRALYEVLPPDALDALKQDVFAVLATRRTPDGIPYVQRVRLVVGTKPGDWLTATGAGLRWRSGRGAAGWHRAPPAAPTAGRTR